MCCDGSMGNACGGGTHQYLGIGVFSFDGFCQSIFYMISYLYRGQRQSVIAVNGAFDAACPCEGVFGTQENCTDGQQVFCNLFFDIHSTSPPKNSRIHL